MEEDNGIEESYSKNLEGDPIDDLPKDGVDSSGYYSSYRYNLEQIESSLLLTTVGGRAYSVS